MAKDSSIKIMLICSRIIHEVAFVKSTNKSKCADKALHACTWWRRSMSYQIKGGASEERRMYVVCVRGGEAMTNSPLPRTKFVPLSRSEWFF
jgi:hypothetical protein